MRRFNEFTVELLEELFGVIPAEPQQQGQHDAPEVVALREWLQGATAPPPDIQEQLAALQQKLTASVLVWNEEELKVKFIALLLNMVEYDEGLYQSFWEREIRATVQGLPIAGVADLVVAQGRFAPRRLFFCLHEYKKEREQSGDPLGQVLVAMLAAQQINENDQPVYGAYVVGRNWFFVVLKGQRYAVSLAYDATKDEIFAIYAILKHLKTIIVGMIAGEA